MRTEIKRLIHKIKCTTVYVTHDQLEAMSLADKIAVINFGVLQQYGTPAEVYDDPVNEFVASFIGDPPMNILETTTVKIDNDFFFTFKDSDLKIRPCPSGITAWSATASGARWACGPWTCWWAARTLRAPPRRSPPSRIWATSGASVSAWASLC